MVHGRWSLKWRHLTHGALARWSRESECCGTMCGADTCAALMCCPLLLPVPALVHLPPAAEHESGTLGSPASSKPLPDHQQQEQQEQQQQHLPGNGNKDGQEWATVYSTLEQHSAADTGGFARGVVSLVFTKCALADVLQPTEQQLVDHVANSTQCHPLGTRRGFHWRRDVITRLANRTRTGDTQQRQVISFRGGADDDDSDDDDDDENGRNTLVTNTLEELRGAAARLRDWHAQVDAVQSPAFWRGYYVACQLVPADEEWRRGRWFDSGAVPYLWTLVNDLKSLSNDLRLYAEFSVTVPHLVKHALLNDGAYDNLLSHYRAPAPELVATEDKTRQWFRELLEEFERHQLPPLAPITIVGLQVCLFVLFSVFDEHHQSVPERQSRHH